MKTLRSVLVLWLSLSPSVIGAGTVAGTCQDHDMLHVLEQGETVFDPQAKPELAVMRAKTGHVLVRPTINGHEAGWFIFDTGAAICVISTPRAEGLELTTAGEMAAHGTGGGSTARGLVASTLALGPVTLHDVPLMETDLSFLQEHLGVEIAGVIGHGVLDKCIVELELAAPRIALHDPRSFSLGAGEWSPLSFDHRIPTVSATFEGREGRFHLDIGANASVTFNEPTVRQLGLLEGRELKDARLGGVGGFIAAKQGRLAWLELAGVRLEDVEAMFVVQASGIEAESGRDGSLGIGVLEAFVITLDYGGQRISFQRRPEPPGGG